MMRHMRLEICNFPHGQSSEMPPKRCLTKLSVARVCVRAFACVQVCVCMAERVWMDRSESKSTNQCMAISMGAPDSWIGSERNQIGGRIAAARIVDWSLIQNDCNLTIKHQMCGNPYGALIGFWVRILDLSIHTRSTVCVRAFACVQLCVYVCAGRDCG